MQKNHASVDRTEFFRPARGYTLQLSERGSQWDDGFLGWQLKFYRINLRLMVNIFSLWSPEKMLG